jgi:YHS domain-containing protein
MAAVALSLFLGGTSSGQQAQPPLPDALDGVDVVVLVKEEKEVFGKSAFRSMHEGFAYLFASAENKAEFDRAPEKYAIQMGGLCARMGGTVRGNPSDYLLHEGRIYIFGSDECRKRFSAAPSKYIPKPVPAMPTDAKVVARGQALLDKAAVAHGGARLDGLTTYVETSTGTQQRQMGPVSIAAKNMWRFPGHARSERILPMGTQKMTVTTVLTPSDAWARGNARTSTPAPAALPSIEATLWRSLIPLLRIREDQQVKVAALPASGNSTGDRVRIIRKGLDVMLNIDRASGRVRSLTYADRNPEGEVGEITISFGDFRTVEGLLVPFVEDAVFNGVPSQALSRRLDSATVNPPLDRSLFSRPAESGGR